MKKIIIVFVIFLSFVFLGTNEAKADETGCCVTSQGCQKSVLQSACTAKSGTFVPMSGCQNDPKCTTSTTTVGSGNQNGTQPTSGPSGTGTSTDGCADQAGSFPNPLRFCRISQVVQAVLDNLRNVIGILAVVFIVIGGTMYMVSGGEKELMEKGKKTMTAAMIGLAIALAAPSFLREIQEILGGSSQTSVESALRLKDILMKVLNFLLSVVGILGIITLVYGGFTYLTSYGEKDRIESGKKVMTYAIIGIVLSFGALVIVRQISNFFVQ